MQTTSTAFAFSEFSGGQVVVRASLEFWYDLSYVSGPPCVSLSVLEAVLGGLLFYGSRLIFLIN